MTVYEGMQKHKPDLKGDGFSRPEGSAQDDGGMIRCESSRHIAKDSGAPEGAPFQSDFVIHLRSCHEHSAPNLFKTLVKLRRLRGV